ncbi:MAG: DUF1428 domain-containing protein [Pseudomonadota bacterium]
MTYVDGFLAAVPTKNKQAYLDFATLAAVVFKDHGALTVVECWGDDVPEGKLNSMHTAVLREPDETVVFSWITWPSKEVRDAGMPKVFADERMAGEENAMPLDGNRMIFGGFEMILDA